jgi:cellulose biosynthesis protein BcsQ
MIKSFNQIQILQERLQELKSIFEKEDKNLNYKITKQLNQKTTLNILSEDTLPLDIYEDINNKEGYPPIEIRYIDAEEYSDDKEYWDNYFDTKSVFEGSTRRLENAFGKYSSIKDDELPTIVSFYSYKGGVGRSTTLAAFASYHARRTGAKVLVIDCDFEAPGFSNFYGMDEQDLSAKNGVVEYLIDSSYAIDRNTLNLDNYIHTISASASKEAIGYAGDKGGAIYVMKAGNLSVETIDGNELAPHGLKSHQDHYLQGLSRIDFSNSEYIVEQISNMIKHICSNKDYNPDVIIIDSRTGFNDIFNNIALRLSDIILGFFGTSRQNIPGIYEFLDTITIMEHSPEIILVNSLCADVSDSYIDFKEIIAQYDQKTDNEMRNLPIWSVEYNSKMSKIGTPRDKGDDLLIYTDPERYRFPDYQNGSKGDTMLEYLSKQLEKKKRQIDTIPKLSQEELIEFNIQPVTKDEILTPLLDFFTNENYSHAEGKSSMVKDDFLSHYFYFRNYLADIFKKEIFLVRGYKGTGKTLIYNALQNEKFTKKLSSIYNVNGDFIFLNIVSNNNYPQLEANKYTNVNLGLSEATYYKRFWVIYVWNEVMKRIDISYKSELQTIEITNEEITRENIEALMHSYSKVEGDLKNIDKILKDSNKKLVISFDYLDDIVSLKTLGRVDNAIKVLIDWCRTLPYDNIYPKIFIRTDLYNKIHGNTNRQGLENKVLSLDWNSDEIFAYFFKIVYAKTSDKFINWLFLRNDTEKAGYIINIKKLLDDNNGQITLENKGIIEFLVNNFFGEFIDIRHPNYGKTYTWFYNNLTSANDVFSLRPFIALLEKAISDAKKVKGFMEDDRQPILSGQFFSSNAAREYAAGKHFDDITKAADGSLRMFADTMRQSNPALKNFRKMSLDEQAVRALIIKIYELNGDYNVPREKWTAMLEKLVDVGIIRQNSSFKPTYSFAFLYKFYLRLSGNPAGNR